MSKGLLGSIVGLLAIVLLAAGCGGGDDTSSTTATLTKAEFLKQGNQICAEGNKEIDAGFEEFAKENNLGKNEEPTEAQLEESAETIILPGVTKQVEGVAALPVPSGEEDKVDPIIEGAEEALEKVEADPSILTDEKNDPFAEVNKLAGAYGLTACAGE